MIFFSSTFAVVDCEHPGLIENGRVIVMNDTTTYNSAVEYHCVPHFQRVGPFMRKCLDDGQWSGEQPYCQSENILRDFHKSFFEIRINFTFVFVFSPNLLAVSAVISDTRTLGLAVTVGGGIVLFLVILLALIYLRL